ncbi:MAG: hypothetical protein JNM10_07650 [Planctomycetia bacterium]|nr:hypothetical protein [Planctomycetia bacterium]
MLTAPEIQEALRRSGRNPEEMARAMEAELKARLGSDYLASANKAKEMAERPLTAADVERYIELAPLLQPIRTDQAASEKLLTAHGTSQLEHAVLVGRIIAARMMLRIGKEPDDEKMKQTLELVRPYADRIDAATRAR